GSIPFPDRTALIRVRPLRRGTEEDPPASAVCTGARAYPNTCLAAPSAQRGKTTLVSSYMSDKQLTNRILLTDDAAAHQNAQVTLTFEDVAQQFKAGRTFGDFTRRAVEKPYTAFGVTDVGEAGRLGNLLLDLGEFDEGGLRNNLRVQFTTW